MFIQEEALYNLDLGYEDCPLQPIHARLAKNSIPKTLWEKGHGEKSTRMTLTYTCTNSLGFQLWVPLSSRFLHLWPSSPCLLGAGVFNRLRVFHLWYHLGVRVSASEAFLGLHLRGPCL